MPWIRLFAIMKDSHMIKISCLETTSFGELLKSIKTLKELNLFGWKRASGHHSLLFPLQFHSVPFSDSKSRLLIHFLGGQSPGGFSISSIYWKFDDLFVNSPNEAVNPCFHPVAHPICVVPAEALLP
jgi:hypothetical protein